MLSVQTNKRRRLTRLINRWATRLYPGIRYSSVQINFDYKPCTHIDGNNEGPSYTISGGDFEGGELWIRRQGGGAPYKVDRRISGFPDLLLGQLAEGDAIITKGNLHQMEGSVPHAVFNTPP